MSEFTDRLEKATDAFFSDYLADRKEEANGEAPALARPVDTWQLFADARREYDRKRFPNGATKKFRMQAEASLEGVRNAHTRAKMNVERATQHGDKMRARIYRQQYMEDYFLPAVEAIVMLGSADEMLNSRGIIDDFDELAMLEGGLSGKGYTESIIRSLYDDKLGNRSSRSDAVVRGAIREIESQLSAGNVRLAVKSAEKMLGKISAGENSADDSDFEMLQRVAMRGQ